MVKGGRVGFFSWGRGGTSLMVTVSHQEGLEEEREQVLDVAKDTVLCLPCVVLARIDGHCILK